ncbi:hypothetical protein BDP27DRAFT_1359680 [Rhodocollybia butyracea]|uniref:Uncharacterized protein n=1 Tax=Rhodocollybia butyracea TaxID=206335 RepID=A0A9P5Q322_9AGAR|nr:hypothetical protein BDP27DRAFT_1359680 [Rhodocollybia butyracea]
MAGMNCFCKKKEEITSRYRTNKFWLYSVAFVFLFGMTAAELGLVSDLLHKGGNNVENYPSAEFKHDLGILLFTCIAEFLYIIGHAFIEMGLNIFINFSLAVFWGAGAGILFQVSPFESRTCDKSSSVFTSNWASYADNCSRVVAMQGLAWALWGLSLTLMFGMFFHLVEFKTRRNVSIPSRKDAKRSVASQRGTSTCLAAVLSAVKALNLSSKYLAGLERGMTYELKLLLLEPVSDIETAQNYRNEETFGEAWKPWRVKPWFDPVRSYRRK